MVLPFCKCLAWASGNPAPSPIPPRVRETNRREQLIREKILIDVNKARSTVESGTPPRGCNSANSSLSQGKEEWIPHP
jgi:hypothetical protein